MGDVIHLREWDNEPDVVSFEITGRGPLYAQHKKRRIREKWAKKDGFREEDFTVHCVVIRTPMKNLNGYVGVPKRHPWFRFPYHHRALDSMMVHGGLTFSGFGTSLYRENAFKFGLWYFGFDTAHFGDYVPQLEENLKEIRKNFPPDPLFEQIRSLFADRFEDPFKTTYKNLAYVENEVRQLAEQLIVGGGKTYGYAPDTGRKKSTIHAT